MGPVSNAAKVVSKGFTGDQMCSFFVEKNCFEPCGPTEDENLNLFLAQVPDDFCGPEKEGGNDSNPKSDAFYISSESESSRSKLPTSSCTQVIILIHIFQKGMKRWLVKILLL